MGISFDINNKCVYAKYKLINYPLNYYCSKRIYAFTSFIFPKKSTLKKKKKYQTQKTWIFTFKCSRHRAQKNKVWVLERCCCNAFRFLSKRLHLEHRCSLSFSNFFWIWLSSKNILYFLFGMKPFRGMSEFFSLLCTMYTYKK